MTDTLKVYDIRHTLYHLDEATRMLTEGGWGAISAALLEIHSVRQELLSALQPNGEEVANESE